MNGLLLSAVQQNRQVWLKFYHAESNRIIIVKDNHKPYCFVSPTTAEKISEFPGLDITDSTKFDIVKDKMVNVKKVSTNNVNLIYSKDDQNALCNMYQTWEADMKLYESYLYDKGLIVGRWYNIHTLKPVDYLSNITGLKVNTEGIIDKEKFQRQVAKWASLLDEPIPKIRRLAFDIEVETGGSMPDPTTAEERVTAISFESEDRHEVFVLNRKDVPLGTKKGPYDCVESAEIRDYKLRWFESEKEMLEEAFEIIESYPVVLTYNGDMFDMPYLYNRAVNLGISHIPFHTMGKNATLNLGIHIDMYGVFKNRSLKIYAFKSKYVEDGLDSVSKAMLGEGKIEYDGELTEIPLYLLAKYCYNDSRLTYKLSSFNNDLVMNLLIILSRISNLPIDDVSRLAISNWIKSLLYFTHRQNGELIPRSDDFPKVEASTESSTDKKYEGAIVLEPQAGIHFDVKVLDFASLYPSIIKTKNISYETVCCSHPQCTTNVIPQTKHWACTKKTGIVSMLIGTLKELRVGHFKQLSKTTQDTLKKQQDETISEALKVFLNASYGVIGFSS
ncbi:MAG: ribonuclease H-like domain-containing protein, partial [Thaumarchaeota archaeon]|nr:ribonuclease H-like domain-containing protein [Nitrososphaerota archaeon]